jgi:hypothetical protein
LLYASGAVINMANGPIVRARVSCLGAPGCASISNVATVDATGAALPINPNFATFFSNDNQLIRGNDGHPLFIKQTFETSGGLTHVSEFVWRSTDCGANFAYLGKVDSLAYACPAGGTYGDTQPSGAPGGFDRVEVYRDPWSNTLFLGANGSSTSCSDALLFSSSTGASWTKVQKLTKSQIPVVMTSTQSGNLYTLQCENTGPAVVHQFSNVGQTAGPVLTISGAGCAWPGLPAMTGFHRDIGGFQISRVGTFFDAATPGGFDVLRAFIPRLSGGVFVIDVYKLEFRQTPTATLMTTITPTAGFGIRHFALVEPELLERGTAANTDVVMAFWREIGVSSGAGSERIMYTSITDTATIAPPTRLSAFGPGTANDWDWATDGSWWDYAKGGSYWNGANWQFFGQWTRTVGGNMVVFANSVTLAD